MSLFLPSYLLASSSFPVPLPCPPLCFLFPTFLNKIKINFKKTLKITWHMITEKIPGARCRPCPGRVQGKCHLSSFMKATEYLPGAEKHKGNPSRLRTQREDTTGTGADQDSYSLSPLLPHWICNDFLPRHCSHSKLLLFPPNLEPQPEVHPSKKRRLSPINVLWG